MEREMHYRTAKYIIKLLYINGILTLQEATVAQLQLLERFDPPFRSIEEIGDIYEENRENRSNEEIRSSK